MIRRFRALPLPVKAIGIGLLYYVVILLSLLLRAMPENVGTLWPASGLAVAILLLTPRREWFAYVLALMLAGSVPSLMAGRGVPVSLGYAAIDGVEAVLAALLMLKCTRTAVTFGNLRDVVVLSLLAATVSGAVSATLAAAIHVVNGGQAAFWSVWWVWFAGVVLGIVAVTPMVVTWGQALQNGASFPEPERVLEILVLYASLTLCTLLIFQPVSQMATLTLLYLPIPLLIWAALRFGPSGAAFATLILATIAVWATIHGHGPLTMVAAEVTPRVRWLQFYLCVALLSTQMVAAVEEDRRQKEKALRESEAKYRFFTDNARDLISLISTEGVYLFVSPACVRLLGYSQQRVLGQSVFRLIHPDDLDEVRAFLQAVVTNLLAQTIQFRARNRAGTYLWFETTAEPVPDAAVEGGVAIVCVSRDISERKRVEEQVIQAQKMESIGRLAGGIAHDFNNLLTAILGYTELAQSELLPGSDVFGYLNNVRSAGDRATGLTRQLLAFARQQVIEARPLNLNDIMQESTGLLERLITENILLESVPASGLWLTKMDAGQVQQILLNLVINARDAMPTGGRLTIETDNAVLDSDYARQHPDATPGEYVLLVVTDTGTGMSKEVQSRIFEPFFTTKEVGKGTGMGLATCYGIVQQNGGHIGVTSEPGRGTTFRVYFPRLTKEVEAVNAKPELLLTAGGTETVLVVEDEAMVRDFCVESLQKKGYLVLEAENGAAAREKWKTFAAPIHLLLTDIVMPQMSADELVPHFLTAYPQARVLYMSGYTENTVLRQEFLEGSATFLQKPFTKSDLLNRVRRVLDEGREQRTGNREQETK